MITLPVTPAPNGVTPMLVDTGLYQRGGVGATIERIERPGMHMAAEYSYPPMPYATAMVFVARLMRAKSAGIILNWPLLGVSQAGNGSPSVDGGASSGVSLMVKGMTPGFVAYEGFWVSVVDPAGKLYLHSVQSTVTVASDGRAVLPVWPPQRSVFADGNPIYMTVPKIAGAITSEIKWPLPVQRVVTLSFTVEEMA